MNCKILTTGHFPCWTPIGDPHKTVVLYAGNVVERYNQTADQDGYNVPDQQVIVRHPSLGLVVVPESNLEPILL